MLALGIDNSAAASLVQSKSIYPISRQVRYGYTIYNKTNRLIKKVDFWTYAPVKQTSTQRCIALDASHPYDLILDDLGNQILYFKFDNLPPYATKIINIKADLSLFNEVNSMPLNDMDIFLCSEKYLEFDHPELSQFARRFKTSTPVNTARNIFLWIAENIKYSGYLRDDRGALYAFKNREGDCTEIMYLFVALCRAHNIPAQGMGGYICNENTILKPSDYHNWAEFYIDGAWRIADPQKKVFMEDKWNYIAMRVIGKSSKNPMGEFHRFRYIGDGIKVKMNK
ncbi:MAG: transglutaminase-like domain-containing protein [bacterium]